jgi:hypothetical protein
LTIISTYFQDYLFSPLDPVFPGPYLLAKYWMLASNSIQRKSHDLTTVQDMIFSMSLATANAFHQFIQQSSSIDMDSVPVDIQTDFVAAVHELQHKPTCLLDKHVGLYTYKPTCLSYPSTLSASYLA